jgi:hypothetical protein
MRRRERVVRWSKIESMATPSGGEAGVDRRERTHFEDPAIYASNNVNAFIGQIASVKSKEISPLHGSMAWRNAPFS